MPDLRVIFVNRVYWPSTAATAQLLTDLAEGLAARGIDVHVIAAGEAPDRHRGVTIHRTGGTDHHRGLVTQAFNYRRFQRVAQRVLSTLVRPGDVVVPMTDPPLIGAAVTGEVITRGGEVIPWIQDIYPEILAVHLGRWTAPFLARVRHSRNRAWRAARRCITLGEDMADTVAAGGVARDRILVLPNWAPRELAIAPTPEAIAARRRAWGVGKQFVVAYSGNLGRVHEFAAVLQAAEQVRTNPRIIFLFIGNGARFGEIRATAAARALRNVRWLPPETRADLPAALAAADAQLVTLKPGFQSLVYPSKLAGVLAASRPVLFVGPPNSEIPRLLARARCGTAHDPHDGAGIATALSTWAADPELCQRLGRNARVAYEEHFTFAAALNHWEACLRSAVAK